MTAGMLAGRYPYGQSNPRTWPRGVREVTARITAEDVAGRKDLHPVSAAVRRALELPPQAKVRLGHASFCVRLGQAAEPHYLPRPVRDYGAGDEITFATAEDWPALASGEGS